MGTNQFSCWSQAVTLCYFHCSCCGALLQSKQLTMNEVKEETGRLVLRKLWVRHTWKYFLRSLGAHMGTYTYANCTNTPCAVAQSRSHWLPILAKYLHSICTKLWSNISISFSCISKMRKQSLKASVHSQKAFCEKREKSKSFSPLSESELKEMDGFEHFT